MYNYCIMPPEQVTRSDTTISASGVFASEFELKPMLLSTGSSNNMQLQSLLIRSGPALHNAAINACVKARCVEKIEVPTQIALIAALCCAGAGSTLVCTLIDESYDELVLLTHCRYSMHCQQLNTDKLLWCLARSGWDLEASSLTYIVQSTTDGSHGTGKYKIAPS